jgi:hypothetical protein
MAIFSVKPLGREKLSYGRQLLTATLLSCPSTQALRLLRKIWKPYCPLRAIILSSKFKFQTPLHNLEMKQFFNCLLILTIPQKLPAVSFRWLMNLYEQTGNQQSADYCRQTAL